MSIPGEVRVTFGSLLMYPKSGTMLAQGSGRDQRSHLQKAFRGCEVRLPRPAKFKSAGLATTVLIVKVEKLDLGCLRAPRFIRAHH